MKTKNPHTRRQLKKPSLHNSRQVVYVAGCVTIPGQPRAEGGPVASQILFDSDVRASWVLEYAITQTATKPKSRLLMNSPEPMAVFVISDTVLTDDNRSAATAAAAVNVGTYSEAKSLADKARWIQLPAWAEKEQVVDVAVNEVQALRAANSSIEPGDILFLIWKKEALSFKEAPALDIGREICDSVFTLGTVSVPAFTGEADD